jgi:hypothetical protein
MVKLAARMTAARWDLATTDANGMKPGRSASLWLSPAIGWAMVQSVLTLGTRVAPAITALWLLAWFVPLGFWGGRSLVTRRTAWSRVAGAACCAVPVLVATFLTASLTGTAGLRVSDAIWCLAGAVGAALMARTDHAPASP